MSGLIDDHVSAIGDRLRGSVRLRADILAEIRDGLVDAAEAYQRAGLTGPEAQRKAVREFGPARQIAADLQHVLAVAQGRRTALLLFVVLGAQYAGSELFGRTGGWQQLWEGVPPGPGYLWLARATDVFSGLALVAAVVAAVLLRWGLRHFDIRLAAIRLTAVLASVVVGVGMVCGALLTVLAPGDGGVRVLVGGVGWAVSSALLLASARHCWLAAAERPDLRVATRVARSGASR
ncbi:hypothetical protein Pen02_04410 [Plantactinospora endophytica]|uniref:Uncharacterized protein n=1 Tax=Plantactinospora endophytica TaxID=673535 RepID=A0ABQ4DSU7_9ACTN|nr:hypothetical protein Pen02_04410 [Plantactinospora endophytica]